MDIMDFKRPAKEMPPMPPEGSPEEEAMESPEEEASEDNPTLADATDDQLLEECKRRGIK